MINLRKPAFLFYIIAWLKYWRELEGMVRRKLIYAYKIPRINLRTGVVTSCISPYQCANYIDLSFNVKASTYAIPKSVG